MKLCVITPCLAETRDFIRLLDESCYRFGIDLKPHGIGRQFSDWRTMLIAETLPSMRELSKDYSHVLYVDGRDSIFVSDLGEIIQKYCQVGSPPCFMSHDCHFPGVSVQLNAGGYMGEIPFIVEMWTRLANEYGAEDANYQNWVNDAYPIEGLVCDWQCRIFQSINNEPTIKQGRVYNMRSGQMPCILHFRGGYSDPVHGREVRIKPVIEKLYGVSA